MDNKDKKNMNFNIYYLNLSKVYEISMMINNVVTSSMQRERIDTNENFQKLRVSLTSYLGSIKSLIGYEAGTKNVQSTKLTESLEVITTKSILLREIISKCKSFNTFTDCKEGDLVKIDKLSLSILDEDTLRGILVLRKDALKGFSIEGFELNNLISSMLQDYSYVLKGIIDKDEKEDDEKEDVIILKIPLEIENEFENKYNVYDLLIGHLSAIGVYKGTVKEDLIKLNTFDYFANYENQENQQQIDEKIIPSSNNHLSNSVQEKPPLLNKGNTTFHFVDIIALIQDIDFEPQTEDIKLSKWKILWNFIRNGGRP
jgi:hypothetical protein